MTDLQIKYQNLVLDRERVARELELNERQISEVERHNLETEDQARKQLGIAQHQADSARIQALASKSNAETNRLNYGVNYMNAETNRYNAETNRLNYGVNAMNAETNRLNYAVNAQNAATNARNAEINAQNAQTNAGYLQLERILTPYKQNQLAAQAEAARASAAASRASAADIGAKTDAGYWQSAAWSNYANTASGATRALTGLGLVSAGAKAATKAAGAGAAGSSVLNFASLAKYFTSENMVQGAMWNWVFNQTDEAVRNHRQSLERLSELRTKYGLTKQQFGSMTAEELRDFIENGVLPDRFGHITSSGTRAGGHGIKVK